METQELAYARGCAHTLQLLYQALVTKPGTELMAQIRELATQCSLSWSEDFDVAHYDERFFVPISPLYTPLSEQSVRTAQIADDKVTYGSLLGNYANHVQQCYQAYRFDYRGLVGDATRVASLSADSLAAELAFLATIKAREAEALEAGDQTAVRAAAHWFAEFATQHTLPFMAKAAECLHVPKADFYTLVVTLAHEVVQLMTAKE